VREEEVVEVELLEMHLDYQVVQEEVVLCLIQPAATGNTPPVSPPQGNDGGIGRVGSGGEVVQEQLEEIISTSSPGVLPLQQEEQVEQVYQIQLQVAQHFMQGVEEDLVIHQKLLEDLVEEELEHNSNCSPAGGIAGTANTGGGGGGGLGPFSSGTVTGGAGGSGIVIIKELTKTVAPGVWSLQCQYNYKKAGQWTPSAPFSVDYLVVAGGGGGGARFTSPNFEMVVEVEQVVIGHLFQVEQN
jgi:hypothetical protein